MFELLLVTGEYERRNQVSNGLSVLLYLERPHSYWYNMKLNICSASEDGRISVRRIHEGSGEDGKLTENILLAVQLVGDWETCHPRLCWHPNSQVNYSLRLSFRCTKESEHQKNSKYCTQMISACPFSGSAYSIHFQACFPRFSFMTATNLKCRK